MARKGTKKVRGRTVPAKGYRFVKGGGGRVVKVSGSSKRSTSRRKSSSSGARSCAGTKIGKGGRVVLKKGYKWRKGGGGCPIKA